MKNVDFLAPANIRAGRPRSGKAINPVQTLDRSLRVLEQISLHQPVTLSDASRLSGLHSSTVFRIIETLRMWRLVELDETLGQYRVGVKAFEFGNAYLTDRPLTELAQDSMKHLSEITRESVNLAVRDGNQAVYIKQIPSSHTIRMFTQVGASAPLHSAAIGKILMQDFSREEVASLLGEDEWERYTDKTITRIDDMMTELAKVRDRGIAWDNEERELGVRCIAATVRDAKGSIVASLSLSAPTSRMTIMQCKQYEPILLNAARNISRNLGYDDTNSAA